MAYRLFGQNQEATWYSDIGHVHWLVCHTEDVSIQVNYIPRVDEHELSRHLSTLVCFNYNIIGMHRYCTAYK